jgi:Glycosyl transferase family 11
MIVTELNGGLGNQMFQYAFARRLQGGNNEPIWLDCAKLSDTAGGVFDNGVAHRPYELHRFDLPARQWSRHQDVSIFGQTWRQRLLCRAKRLMGINQVLVESANDQQLPACSSRAHKVYCRGYWHHHCYSTDAVLRRTLVADFNFSRIVNDRCQALATEILDSANPTVSLHVRRGDYLSAGGSAVQGLCDAAYYSAAREMLHQRHGQLRYFVFSDDISWCRQSLGLPSDSTYVSGDPDLDAHQELSLMTECNHHVLANSTFSWWGWILRKQPGGDCVAPKRWFADDLMDRQMRARLPKEWIRL